MPLDGVSVRCLASELNQELAGARIDRIIQPDRFSVLLTLSRPKQRFQLFISADPAMPRVYLTANSLLATARPPLFCTLLRKYLSGARIESISSPGYERILIIECLCINEIGDSCKRRLIVELMGRHSNIILVDPNNLIHDAIIQVDQTMSRVREVMPIRPYVLPPAQAKTEPEQVLKAIGQQLPWPENVLNKSSPAALLAWIQGFSPQLCRAVVHTAGLDHNLQAGLLSSIQSDALRQALKDTLSAVSRQEYRPAIYLKDGVPADFHALPLSIYTRSEQTDTLSVAMDRYYDYHLTQQAFEHKQNALLRQVKARLDHVLVKKAIYEANLAKADAAADRQKTGQLILANLHNWQKGSTALEAIDYFEPDQPRIVISITAGRSAANEAKQQFKAADRLKRTAAASKRLLTQQIEESRWLDSVHHSLEQAASQAELDLIAFELSTIAQADKARSAGQKVTASRNHPGKAGSRQRRHEKTIAQNKKQRPKQSSQKQPQQLQPYRFTSQDGFTVLAGRNNLQNDRLTLQTAAKDDWWFHAARIPGSHVIVRSAGQELSEATIELAAAIAAWYSRATSSLGGQSAQGLKVAVDYCPVSHVRKPKGARPGMVTYDRYRTILVTPQVPPVL